MVAYKDMEQVVRGCRQCWMSEEADELEKASVSGMPEADLRKMADDAWAAVCRFGNKMSSGRWGRLD